MCYVKGVYGICCIWSIGCESHDEMLAKRAQRQSAFAEKHWHDRWSRYAHRYGHSKAHRCMKLVLPFTLGAFFGVYFVLHSVSPCPSNGSAPGFAVRIQNRSSRFAAGQDQFESAHIAQAIGEYIRDGPTFIFHQLTIYLSIALPALQHVAH